LELLVDLTEDLKKKFYEVESTCGNCSVREQKPQIASLYYERSGFSTDKKIRGTGGSRNSAAASPGRAEKLLQPLRGRLNEG